jgi:hypothetical protein
MWKQPKHPIWHYAALLEFDLSYSQVASGRNFPPYISSLCIIHPRKNNNPAHQRRRLGIAGIKAGSSGVRATALCWHCFTLLFFFLGSSGNYDHRRRTNVKVLESPLKHIGLVAWRRFTALPEESFFASVGPKKGKKRSKKWKGKAGRPFWQSCFTGTAVPDLLSTATACCRTIGNLSSRSANSARSHGPVLLSIIYKVTIRNWMPCHGSRLSPQRPMFDPWAVDAESVVDTEAMGQAFLQVLRLSRHYHSTNAP